MNIKDFLIDHYIYIIIVIVLIIITIIGFLADKKTKGRSVGKDILPNNNSNMGNNSFGGGQNVQQPMNYQPPVSSPEIVNPMPQGPLLNNNVPNEPVNFGQVNNNMVNQLPMGGEVNPVATALNQEVSNNNINVLPGTMEGTIVNAVSPVETQSMPQPVTPLTSTIPVNSESMYQQPLQEVTPAIMPATQMNYNQPLNTNNMPNSTIPNVTNVVPNNMETVGITPTYSNVNQQMQNVNPAPIPTPVVPTPPVSPIPSAPNTPVSPMPMPNPNTTVPNPVSTPQPVNNGQFNYTYGSQPGNQNMQ